MPCDSQILKRVLLREVSNAYPKEYDTIGQVCYFLGLTDDSYFEEYRKAHACEGTNEHE